MEKAKGKPMPKDFESDMYEFMGEIREVVKHKKECVDCNDDMNKVNTRINRIYIIAGTLCGVFMFLWKVLRVLPW